MVGWVVEYPFNSATLTPVLSSFVTLFATRGAEHVVIDINEPVWTTIGITVLARMVIRSEWFSLPHACVFGILHVNCSGHISKVVVF